MPRSKRTQLGLKWYKRRQAPALYLYTGKLRPCCVCKQVEHKGRTLYGKVTFTPYMKYVMVDGHRDIEQETTPDGDTQPRRYVREETVNYHAECEAEDARERRRRAPKRKHMQEQLEDALERIAILEAGKRETPRESLRKASQTSPGFVGAGSGPGYGKNVRNQFNLGAWVRGEGTKELPPRDPNASVVGKKRPGTSPESESQPDPVPPPLPKRRGPREPIPLEYDNESDPLTDEGAE